MLADVYRQRPTTPMAPTKTGQFINGFGGTTKVGQQMQTDQWGRPIPPSQILREQLMKGGVTGTVAPMQTIPAAPNLQAPVKPGGVAAPTAFPNIPGAGVTPGGVPFIKTGNEMLNRLLASGLFKLSTGSNGMGFIGGGGPSPIDQLFTSGPGAPGFVPAPFRQESAPYVPPSLGGTPGVNLSMSAGQMQQSPQYGFDDPITKALRDAQALRARSQQGGFQRGSLGTYY